MAAKTAVPYELPYPIMSDTPDIPRDVQALAARVHTQLDALSTRIAANRKDIDTHKTSIDKLDTLVTKLPNQWTSNILTPSTGFTCSYQRMWRWGYMVAVELQVYTTVDRSNASGNIGDVYMGTWKTTIKPNWNYPLTSMVDGQMAMGYSNSKGIVLSTLEAAVVWKKSTPIRFAGFYMTSIARP